MDIVGTMFSLMSGFMWNMITIFLVEQLAWNVSNTHDISILGLKILSQNERYSRFETLNSRPLHR